MLKYKLDKHYFKSMSVFVIAFIYLLLKPVWLILLPFTNSARL